MGQLFVESEIYNSCPVTVLPDFTEFFCCEFHLMPTATFDFCTWRVSCSV